MEFGLRSKIGLALAGVTFGAVLGSFACGAAGQGYAPSVIATGLDKPHGIALAPSGDVYFTELPEPGRTGGRNTVSRRDTGGNVSVVVRGEPGPTNISVIANGDFYWTCSTVGVILSRSPNSTGNRLVRSGLRNPSGISVTDAGLVHFTQVPTPGRPGSMGGSNTVSVLRNNQVVDLSKGEPEPVDVAVDQAGNAYWTCKTAGVILRRDAVSAQKSVVLRGLRQPNGLAMDNAGNLYFTEVPTPGLPGSRGGKNAVWKYDVANATLTLINFGDPEPIDVTVSADGRRVLWTCKTAGVIVEAMPSGPGAAVTSTSSTRPGETVRLDLAATADGGLAYRAATALGLGPIPIDQRFLPLAADALFFLSAQNLLPATFRNYAGTLDAQGRATASMVIPNDSAVTGLEIFTAFVTLNGSAPSGVNTISSALRTTVQ